MLCNCLQVRQEIHDQALAIADIEEDETRGPSGRTHANIRDVEAILYRRARVLPRPPRKTGDTEKEVEAVDFNGKLATAVLMETAKLVKTCTSASLAALRGIKKVTDKIDVHSRALLDLQDDVSHLRRVLRRYDTPLHTQEFTTNPSLNPALNNFVPFDNQVLVNEFFQSSERTTELTKYVLHNVKWNVSTFCRQMIATVCTLDYREKYAFPGDNVQARLTYIPKKLEQFFVTTARIAAHRKKAAISTKRVRDQCRVAFQKNTVIRDRKRMERMGVSAETARRTYEGFPVTDDEGEELREDYELDTTLVHFESTFNVAANTTRPSDSNGEAMAAANAQDTTFLQNQ